MSYIVKNCPAITEYKFSDKVHKDCCQCRYGYCKDIDCVIKQVIEKCEESIKYFKYGVPEHSTDTAMTYTEKMNKADFAMQILDLFDIEEINK